MIATVDGDIFYVRNARVPKRPSGFDYKKPLPGNTSKSEWTGFYTLDELLQFENPKTGYLQNCNVSPQFMAKNLGLDIATYKDKPWLLNGYESIAKRSDNPLHQRAAMCVELLDANTKMSVDDAIAIAMSPDVYGADAWQKRLKAAWEKADEKFKGNANAAKMVELILAWNRRCEPTSTGAIAYRYWKEPMYRMDNIVKTYDLAGFPIAPTVDDKMILSGLVAGAKKLEADFGRMEVAYGDVYRVGRKGSQKNWPVGGGSVEGIATPRAIGFDKIGETPTFLGRGGQTSTQVVLLTKPPKSWTVLPLGNSDHPESKHFDDQAEKLFSQGKMKPTYFADKAELMKHVESTKVLTWNGK
jgi:acyl-homoserine lactone acylase PvdQ